MNKILLLLLLLGCSASAQQKLKWFTIENVIFYGIKNSDCEKIHSAADIPKDAKPVTYKKPKWESILPIQTQTQRDVANTSNCYLLLVKFKDGQTIPFQLFPDQKALFDLRPGHFDYFLLANSVYKKFDAVLKQSVDCANDPNCQQVR